MRTSVIIALAVFVLAAQAGIADAAPGDLDPSFGSAGIALLESPAGYLDSTRLTAISVAPDGGIGVAGFAAKDSGEDLVVGRLTASGAPDPVFGHGELVPVPGANGLGHPVVVALADGRTLVAAGSGDIDDSDVLLARLRPDGSLDPGFGSGGVAHFKAAGTSDTAPSGMAVLQDGRIVVSGFVRIHMNGTIYTRILLARFMAGGAPDPSFDGDGYTIRSLDPSQFQDAQGLALEPSGRATVAGNQGASPSSGLVARYTPSGGMDSSFGFGGFIGPGTDDTTLAGVALPGDGSTIAAGDEDGRPYAARITVAPAGGPSSGYVYRSLVMGSDRGADVTGVVADSGGRAFLGGTGSLYGSSPNGGPGAFQRSDALLVALDGAGRLDPVVGGNPPGFRFYAVPGHRVADFRAIVAAPGDRLLLAGTVQPDFGSVFHAAVLQVQAPPPAVAPGGGQSPAGGGAPPPAGSADGPRIRRLRRTVLIDLKTGRGAMWVRCEAPPGDICRARLSLRGRTRRHAMLGAASGTLRGGRSGKLSFRLSHKGLRRLRHAPKHRLPVLARGTARNRAGATAPIRQKLTLKGRRR